MKSNYRKLGEYIRQVDVRNTEGKDEHLLGVSVQKMFMPSIANTIGTDFSKYKVVKRGQFTYIPDTSRRGDKIAIALLKDYDEGLVSNIYTVFEISDSQKLMPEYLMLWFSRPEFDRYARFKSHGSVREIMDWDELCKVELPIPSYKAQAEIVREYQTIADRIALKQKINDNLVKLGVIIISKKIGNTTLINKTDSEIQSVSLPNGWIIKSISEFCCETKSGATPSREDTTYWFNGTVPWVKSGEIHNNITIQTEEKITCLAVKETSVKLLPPDTVLMAMYGVTAGEVGYLSIPATTNQAVCGMVCHSKDDSAYLYFTLIQSQEEISRLSNGGAQNNLSKNFIDNINIVLPDSITIKSLGLSNIVKQIITNTKEIYILQGLENTLLSTISRR